MPTLSSLLTSEVVITRDNVVASDEKVCTISILSSQCVWKYLNYTHNTKTESFMKFIMTFSMNLTVTHNDSSTELVLRWRYHTWKGRRHFNTNRHQVITWINDNLLIWPGTYFDEILFEIQTSLFTKTHFKSVVHKFAQRHMDAMTSLITGNSTVFNNINSPTERYQSSASCGESTGDRWIPHTKSQGPVLLQRSDAVAILSVNGSAAFKESVMSQ